MDEFRRSNPGAFILDSLALDQRQGRDTAIIAVWEGAAAENARTRLGRPSEDPAAEADVALVQRDRYRKVHRTRESTFLLIFLGLLAPAVLIVPWVQAHPEPNASPLASCRSRS